MDEDAFETLQEQRVRCFYRASPVPEGVSGCGPCDRPQLPRSRNASADSRTARACARVRARHTERLCRRAAIADRDCGRGGRRSRGLPRRTTRPGRGARWGLSFCSRRPSLTVVRRGAAAAAGTLQVGNPGDVVLLADDPRADMRNFARVQFLVRGGRIVFSSSAR
jgi:hypothetical protein